MRPSNTKPRSIETPGKIFDLRDPRICDVIRERKELWNIYVRGEEYSSAGLDNHGRFDYRSSSYQDISNPLISQHLADNGYAADYPDNKKFAICLTHDVDEIYPPISHALLSTLHHLKNLDLDGLKRQLFWKEMGQRFSPYWNFSEIMELEERYDAKSTFYFMAVDRDVKRFRYDIEVLGEDLGIIADRGFEVGLHGGYFAYDSPEEMKREKLRLERTLGKAIVGYRNHYLRFKVPDTWEHLSKAGFKYDSTFGYWDRPGFRNGMCHPFRPYNMLTESYIDILEIPLCIMDMTLYGQNPDIVDMWEAAEGMMKTAERCGGVLTILWHNNMFSCPFREALHKLYSKILSCAHERGAWLTSAEDIWGWWIDY